MATNKFLIFDEAANNIQTDVDYLADVTRTDGIISGQARSIVHNKLFRQTSIMTSALGELIKDYGGDADDSIFATLVTNLKDTFLNADNQEVNAALATTYDYTGVTNVDDILTSLNYAYKAVPNLELNVAYLLAVAEINGMVQAYSNFFYDLFYAGQTTKVGAFDNRYLTYTGTLALGATTVPVAGISFTNWTSSIETANTEYIEVTISDGVNREVNYIKNVANSFDSTLEDDTYPKTFSLPAGTYAFKLCGGQGEDYTIGPEGGTHADVKGGHGGTIIFNKTLAAPQTARIEKIGGAYMGSFHLYLDNVLQAAVGGGGGGAYDGIAGMYANAHPGGDGGGNVGQDGVSGSFVELAGKGANGATGGLGGTYPTGDIHPGTDGGDYPVSTGGAGEANSNGGAGYAGGGGGGWRYTTNMFGSSGGGGSSYVISSGITLIENSQGTNQTTAYMQILPQTSLTIKTALSYEYTNPVIYRNYMIIDTGTHNATIKSINTHEQSNIELRIKVNNASFDFYSLMSWLEVTNDLTVTSARVVYSSTSNFDESIYIELVPTSTAISTTRTQFMVELLGDVSKKYATLTLVIQQSGSGSEYIYKMLGVLN